MKVLSKKEGGFYNNKILVVSVLMLILIGVLFMVQGSVTSPPRITFNNYTNNSFTTDSTPLINITFLATEAGTNTTIINSSINVTINGEFYNFSDMTCTNPGNKVNQSLDCNFSARVLKNGTYNITAKAMDNSSGSITAILQNFTVYSGPPSIISVNMSDISPTKAGNVTFNITFDRFMNVSRVPVVRLILANGSEMGAATVGAGYNTTFSMYTLYNISFTDNSAARTSTWSGYFIFNSSTEIGSVFDGILNISVSNVRDRLENSMPDDNSTIFVLDTTGPAVFLETADGINQSTLGLNFNFTDNLSISGSCSLYINGTFNVTNGSVTNGTSTTITINDAAAEGPLNWTVECTDLAGNVLNSTSTYMAYIDRTAPVMNEARNSPLDGHYVNTSTLNIIANITDGFTGIKNSTSTLTMAIYRDGSPQNTYKFDGTTPSLALSGDKSNYKMTFSNFQNSLTLTSGHEISIVVTAKDYAGNTNISNTTFYIDNTKPVIETSELDADPTYTQGEILTLTATITEEHAGLNISTAALGINTTTYTSLGTVNLTCEDNKPTYTCTYEYNTSGLEATTLKLNGTIYAADNTDELKNNGTGAVSLTFIIDDAGAPVIGSANITTNLTRIVKDLSTVIQINISVGDETGINTVWATYNDNSTLETCTFFSGGGVTDTSVVAIGNCTINATSSGTSISNNILTLNLYVNDTIGEGGDNPANTYTLIVENEAINVSAFTAPSSPYVNQTITINATVFSWYGIPTVWFNATNSTSTKGVLLNATCISADVKANLYYCANTTNTSVLAIFAGNTSTINVNSTNYGANVDSSLPTALTPTFYASKTITIDKAPSTSTITFVESDVSRVANGNLAVGSTIQNIEIIDTTLSDTVITLNAINLTAMTNFTFEIVPPNSSNGTNYTRIQASLLASKSRTTLLAAMVIQPMINNVSSGMTGSTIAFNCSALNIDCNIDTRVYKAGFNTATNLTNLTAGAWTRLTGVVWSSPLLTVTTDSFSIFALASYTAPTPDTPTITSPGRGRTTGGIGYLLAGKLTAFDIIDMIRDFFDGTSTKTAFDIIDSIREFYEEEE